MRPEQLNNYKGNMDLADEKIKERKANCQKIYDVILIYGPITTAEIIKILKGWNSPLGERTIERCIKGDSRIIKNKRYYSIDEKARFEIRYRDPKDLGRQIYDSVLLDRGFQYNQSSMKNLVNIFGVIMMFVFIESSRPFTDKVTDKGKDKTMSVRDREDLVDYWANNAIPIEQMFRAFKFIFTRNMAERMRHKPVLDVEQKTYNEMTEEQVNESLTMLEQTYPDIYKHLIAAKEKFMSQIKKDQKVD